MQFAIFLFIWLQDLILRFTKLMTMMMMMMKVLTKTTTTHEAVDLVSRVLLYTPSHRMSAIEVIAHPFFDELREPNKRLKHGKRLPPLFNFLPEGTTTNTFLQRAATNAVYATAYPSVRPSVRHIPVLCQNDGTQWDAVFTVG